MNLMNKLEIFFNGRPLLFLIFVAFLLIGVIAWFCHIQLALWDYFGGFWGSLVGATLLLNLWHAFPFRVRRIKP